MVPLITRIGLHLLVLGAGVCAGVTLGKMWDPQGDYAYADGVQQHYLGLRIQARNAWQRAADKGHPGALYCLGAYRALGLIHRAEAAKAFSYYEAAAQKGHRQAQYEVGRALERGEGVPQRLQRAAEWYEKAAWQEHADACFRLGKLYQHGKGVEKNYPLAVYWFRRAADHRHADALLSLSLIYQHYKPLRDTEKAEKLLREAAALGSPFANTILQNGGY